MRFSELYKAAVSRLRREAPIEIPRRYMYGRVLIDDALRATWKAERDADEYKRMAAIHRLMRENGLTRYRAEKYAKRAYPTGWAKVLRTEMRGMVRDINSYMRSI